MKTITSELQRLRPDMSIVDRMDPVLPLERYEDRTFEVE